MKVIVGLGNPGRKYLFTRHNAGFLALDYFCEQVGKSGQNVDWKLETKFNAEVCKLTFGDGDILLVKPHTFMNRSGEAISKIVNFYKIDKEFELLLIYDDIDLPLGKIRFREKGSAGTHNGMKSTIQMLGTENLKRFRIGVESRGETAPQKQETSTFVLSEFLEVEAPVLIASLEEVYKGILENFLK